MSTETELAPVTVEVQSPESEQVKTETPAAVTEAPKDEATQAEKTFTQAELDAIVQKRIAKAEAQAERRVLKALEKFQPQREAPQPVQQNDAKPTLAAYGGDTEAYADALTDWKLEQRDRASSQAKAQEQGKTIQDKTEKLYAEAEELEGFDRDAFDELPLTPHIAQALIDSDVPAKLMAYMASNAKEVERISKLSPARQAAELGKLELKLTSAPKVSKAPAPITPIGNRGSVSTGDIGKMSVEEYLAMRSKGPKPVWMK